jgi:putative ABC transport system permease protein
VGLEVGLSTVLLVLAGLLTASLGQLLGVHAGFAVENVLVAGVDLPPQKYSLAADRLKFYDRVLTTVQSLPGIRAAGWVSIPPLGGEGSVTGFTIPGAIGLRSEIPMANYRPVSTDYFAAMGIPVVQGRSFAPQDRGRNIVVVSQGVAEHFWPGRNPIGETCITEWGPDIPAEVIGVVGDIRTVRLDEPPIMMVYVPEWFNKFSVPASASVVLRSTNDPSTYVAPVRDLVHNIDSEVPLTTLRPMSEVVSRSLDARRFPMILTMVFAASSLALASIGIFGVLAYSVQQRYQELGIRIALGADLTVLLRMVLRQGVAPVMIGLAAGIITASIAARLIGSMLFGVSTHDPVTFASVAIVVSAVALLACYVPARRATRVDPMIALRYE